MTDNEVTLQLEALYYAMDLRPEQSQRADGPSEPMEFGEFLRWLEQYDMLRNLLLHGGHMSFRASRGEKSRTLQIVSTGSDKSSLATMQKLVATICIWAYESVTRIDDEKLDDDIHTIV